jgi:hypothetical protein
MGASDRRKVSAFEKVGFSKGKTIGKSEAEMCFGTLDCHKMRRSNYISAEIDSERGSTIWKKNFSDQFCDMTRVPREISEPQQGI